MNKQRKSETRRGVEWTDYTWNPVGGCKHACRWEMPDGSIAECYAETVAHRIAQSAYPQGFATHYWRPEKLNEPLSVKTPSRVFLDSMSDLMGLSVLEGQVEQVLDMCREANWHTFQLLTKNAPRLKKFDFPNNVWVGVSAPPTFMFGKKLSSDVQIRMFERSLDILNQVRVPVRWMSLEPLSFDIGGILARRLDGGQSLPFEWVVIGAASNGTKVYQPKPEWVERVLTILDEQHIPVFFKGNLEWSPWREHFPNVHTQPVQQSLF